MDHHHSLTMANSTQEPVHHIQLSIQNLLNHWTTRQKYWNPFFADQQHRLSSSTQPWRIKLATFLESTPLRISIIILLLLDLVLTTLDLSSTMLKCHHGNETSSPSSSSSSAAAAFHYVEVAILSLLCAKLVALAVALGPGGFVRRPGYVVDGVVVVGALVVEGMMRVEGGGLMVVVSLWRVVRVVESAFELSDEAIEAQIEGVVVEFEELKRENARLVEMVAERDETVRMLQEMVEMLGR